jgi:hypothetical protein
MSNSFNKTDSEPSKVKSAEVRIRGKNYHLPSTKIGDRLIVITRRFPRTASIKDEEFIQGESVSEPHEFIEAMKKSGIRADLFKFVQKFPDVEPKYNFHFEWDNVAALEVKSFSDWFEKKISVNIRKNLRRSVRRGVSVEVRELNDSFIKDVLSIYNETPVRQGRKFWHYGKNFETVKKEISTYLDRSLFIGAFHEERMIGFIKMVRVDKIARLMHIVSMASHIDKHPTNALIAKAIEVCEQKGCTHLTYGKYIYGRNAGSSLTEFKHRNGFKQFLVPQYFIPLNGRGRLALKTGMHRGLKGMVPEKIFSAALRMRAKYHDALRLRFRASSGSPDDAEQNNKKFENNG